MRGQKARASVEVEKQGLPKYYRVHGAVLSAWLCLPVTATLLNVPQVPDVLLIIQTEMSLFANILGFSVFGLAARFGQLGIQKRNLLDSACKYFSDFKPITSHLIANLQTPGHT